MAFYINYTTMYNCFIHIRQSNKNKYLLFFGLLRKNNKCNCNTVIYQVHFIKHVTGLSLKSCWQDIRHPFSWHGSHYTYSFIILYITTNILLYISIFTLKIYFLYYNNTIKFCKIAENSNVWRKLHRKHSGLDVPGINYNRSW